jgi:hypothetical protein
LKNLSEKEFHKKCFEILDVDILVDSSKNLTWVIDDNIQARKDWFDVFNVLLYKELVSFFYSYWKRGFSINKARKDIFVKYYKHFFQSNLPFIALDYNKLVADPSATLENLCQLLGISYFEGKEKFWEKVHHHLFGSRGTRKQVESANSVIRNEEDYPAEFQKMIPYIEADNLRDKAFQVVLAELKDHEMRQNNLLATDVKKPYWYYLSKLKQKIRQRFSERWEYDQ